MHASPLLARPCRGAPWPAWLGRRGMTPADGTLPDGTLPEGTLPEGAPAAEAALLAALALRQDRAAFATLFARYAPRLKAWLQRCGTPAAEAEELAQEAMLAVWRKAALYDPRRASPAAWIFAIARNLRIDALRRSRLDLPDTDPEAAAMPPPADAVLAMAEQGRRLRDALDGLPAEQGEALRLAFFEEFSHARLQAALGVPLGTVKSRLRRAMLRLRAALKDD